MLSMPRLCVLLLAALVLGCGWDPLLDAQIAALGSEAPNVPRGPLHRPGQPCAACHRPDGHAPAFTVAGTIYRDPVALIAVADIPVALIDAAGKTFTTHTNCVGNFYVRPNEFSPTPPMWVSVQSGPVPFKMESPIHREASCAACHFDPGGRDTAGHIFVADDPTTFDSVPLRACGPADGVKR